MHIHEGLGLLGALWQTDDSGELYRLVEVNDVAVLFHHFKLVHEVLHKFSVIGIFLPRPYNAKVIGRIVSVLFND